MYSHFELRIVTFHYSTMRQLLLKLTWKLTLPNQIFHTLTCISGSLKHFSRGQLVFKPTLFWIFLLKLSKNIVTGYSTSLSWLCFCSTFNPMKYMCIWIWIYMWMLCYLVYSNEETQNLITKAFLYLLLNWQLIMLQWVSFHYLPRHEEEEFGSEM